MEPIAVTLNVIVRLSLCIGLSIVNMRTLRTWNCKERYM